MNEILNEKISKCLNCKTKPCFTGCPLGNNIPEVISLTKQGKYQQAYNELIKTTLLPSICGRICPHMSQCMGKCIRGIKGEPVSIGDIEAYIGDMAIKENWKISKEKSRNEKVAIIGGGPSGLTCAGFLARAGFNVTIFEKNSELGGILRYGIPKFRLDREILNKSIKRIIDLGIEVKYKSELGKNLDLQQLKQQYHDIFISIGANIPCKMGIDGEDLDGVYGGNLLLENIEKSNDVPNFKNKNVAIIGGGNVAIDCARTISKLGANSVKIIYRRSKKEMPAEEKEIIAAEKENVQFLYQNNIVKISGENKVEKIECIKTELVKKEGQTRLCPVNIEDSNYIMDIDCVIMAIGAGPEKNVIEKNNFKKNKYDYIDVDEKFKTSDNKVWAGGDLIGEKSTVAWAAFYGREAAKNIENLHK